MRRRNRAHFWTLVDSRTLPTPCRHVVSAAGALEGRCGADLESCCHRFHLTFRRSQVAAVSFRKALATLQPC